MSAARRRTRVVSLPDPEPWPDDVAGRDLLDDLASWFGAYLFLPHGAADAMSAWTVLTWLVDEIDIAPILMLQSPTKRCGKSVALDLLKRIVRRPWRTSGAGVTSAVLFRLNDEQRPTFLIDEAEKLRSQRDGREMIGLLNDGYRRGGRVGRCADRNGDFVVHDYDAFGLRATASIGALWDTLEDRAIIVPMHRRPRGHEVKRFSGGDVDRVGGILAQKIVRWTNDTRSAFAKALCEAQRPVWLNDRQCDNWIGLFAIANLAGRDWPQRILDAARSLCRGPGEDGDRGERLILDVHAVFRDQGFPEAIKSGDLASSLNGIETSPWGGLRGGRGLSTNDLARRLKSFGVRPDQQRTSDGTKIRGYWYADLQPVFDRYVGTELGHVGQGREDERTDDEAVPVVPRSDPQARTDGRVDEGVD